MIQKCSTGRRPAGASQAACAQCHSRPGPARCQVSGTVLQKPYTTTRARRIAAAGADDG